MLRPDSGDPVETVVLGLRAAEKVFGCDVNAKGYKVPRGCSVIQGALRCAQHIYTGAVLSVSLRAGIDRRWYRQRHA